MVNDQPTGGVRESLGDSRARAGQQALSEPRPLCYCFGHSYEDVEAEVAAGESEVIRQSIVDRCRRGENRCSELNPQGSCCLGDVNRAYAHARSRSDVPSTSSSAEVSGGSAVDCCGVPVAAEVVEVVEVVEGASKGPRAGRLATGGAVLAAAASSACCWLPLLLLAFGASAAGASAFFESVRPYFLGGAGLLLAGGFYLVYVRDQACGTGAECAAPEGRGSRLNKRMLWAATVFTLMLGFFPAYVGLLVDGGDSSIGDASADGDLRRYAVQGMTCEGCASGLSLRLRQLPGVHTAEVDYEAASVQVVLDQQQDDQAVLDAIASAGFQGKRGD